MRATKARKHKEREESSLVDCDFVGRRWPAMVDGDGKVEAAAVACPLISAVASELFRKPRHTNTH